MPPSPPCPSPTRWWQMRASGLLLGWQRWLGPYSVWFLFVCFSLGYVAIWDSKTPHRHACEKVSYSLEISFPSWLPPQDGSPSMPLLSLSFFIYILSYLLSKRMGCLCVVQVSSARVQKLFCESCSVSKWPLDEFVGVKLGSPFYSSTILGPSPMLNLLRFSFLNISMKTEDFCHLSVSFFFFYVLFFFWNS